MSWVGLLNGTVIGPFWFIDDRGKPVGVNQHVYLKMLKKQVWPVIRYRQGIRRVWFQQDGATPHAANLVLNWLHRKFQDRVISRRASVPWPAQSPDLNPLDYWFWGYGSSEIHRQNPATIIDLVDCVEAFSAMVTKDEVLNATAGIVHRLEDCRNNGGGHFQQMY